MGAWDEAVGSADILAGTDELAEADGNGDDDGEAVLDSDAPGNSRFGSEVGSEVGSGVGSAPSPTTTQASRLGGETINGLSGRSTAETAVTGAASRAHVATKATPLAHDTRTLGR
ncbi:MAG: hypothetical protein K9G28_04285 [Candidatus Nanopelagicales bacterium]|nr:hypothetical protein [Candidatus Nanopelagicales bacterium]